MVFEISTFDIFPYPRNGAFGLKNHCGVGHLTSNPWGVRYLTIPRNIGNVNVRTAFLWCRKRGQVTWKCGLIFGHACFKLIDTVNWFSLALLNTALSSICTVLLVSLDTYCTIHVTVNLYITNGAAQWGCTYLFCRKNWVDVVHWVEIFTVQWIVTSENLANQKISVATWST